ncbi:hypothetical protein [Cupriavidus pampae]|uniref:Uncharacterized protein n=1 Tax=Cupriavidus pampae TaxID=659251 RepID=A0ABN7ZDU4_9BURK|nr:hypothetical protein [Cupriavidus pampae]CAG9184127.1 hypothetical protein LMG32289_05519 [Cupriavidus pampae]
MMTMPQRPRGGTTRPPIELGASGAHLRLYPGTDLWVDVPRAVALHLFALVCRANVAKGRSWDRFWRALTQIERSMTVLFVQANGQWEVAFPPEAMLGTTIWLSGLAEDFRAVAAGRCRPPLATDVEQEFETLYAVYVRATVSPDRLQAAWAAQFPKIHALLDRTGVLQILMTDGRCYAQAQVEAIVERVLLEGGEQAVQQIEGWTHGQRCRNDARVFAACAQRLAGTEE